jgi:hypothetical protein
MKTLIEKLKALRIYAVGGQFGKRLSNTLNKKSYFRRVFENYIKKLIFMMTYKKLRHSFEYDVLINDTKVGTFKASFSYGVKTTTLDSFIEVEFVPQPNIKQINSIIIEGTYLTTLTENLKSDSNQIDLLFEKLITVVIRNSEEFKIIKSPRRLVHRILIISNELNVEGKLIYEYIDGNYKIFQISNDRVMKFSYDTSDDEIVGKVYSEINR